MYRVWLVILACLLTLWVPIAPVAAETGKEAPLLENARQLTFEGRRAGEGYFSSDGRQMIFQSERVGGNPFYQMYIMDLETGDLQRISPGHGKTTCGWIHPNGRKALFSSTQDDPKAKEKQKIELEKRALGNVRRYVWSYDEHYDIQEYDLEAGTYRNLTKTLGYDAEGAYSPDGTQIVFASNREAYARTLDAKEQKTFDHDKSYFMDIYVMNADGSNVRRLTKAPGYDGGPFFSADGKKIVWRRFSEDGTRAEVYTMNVDGSDKRQITRLGAMSWAPFFHPSGDYIVFATNLQGFANFELYMVDAKGEKEPVRVTHSKGFDGLAAFSPDGKRLAWASKRTADGTTQIFMADWDDAEARRRLGLTGEDAAAKTTLAQTPEMDRTADEIRAEDLQLHVAALASEEMDGRLTGTDGEVKAGQYVAEVFEALGVAPAGDDGSYFQAFAFTAGVSLGANNALELKTKTGTKALTVDENWRPIACSPAGDVGPTGVAFAGYGLVAPAENDNAAYDSYADLDVAGKWVVVLRGVPQEVTPDRRLALTRYADLRYKASVAQSKGAKGLIVAPARPQRAGPAQFGAQTRCTAADRRRASRSSGTWRDQRLAGPARGTEPGSFRRRRQRLRCRRAHRDRSASGGRTQGRQAEGAARHPVCGLVRRGTRTAGISAFRQGPAEANLQGDAYWDCLGLSQSGHGRPFEGEAAALRARLQQRLETGGGTAQRARRPADLDIQRQLPADGRDIVLSQGRTHTACLHRHAYRILDAARHG